jgi:hypothetical protein
MDLDDLLGNTTSTAPTTVPVQGTENKNALDFFNDVGQINFNNNSAP